MSQALGTIAPGAAPAVPRGPRNTGARLFLQTVFARMYVRASSVCTNNRTPLLRGPRETAGAAPGAIVPSAWLTAAPRCRRARGRRWR